MASTNETRGSTKRAIISSKSVYVVPHSTSFFPSPAGFSGSFSSSSISNVASTSDPNYVSTFPRFYLHRQQQLRVALRARTEEAVPRGEGGQLGGGAARVDAAVKRGKNGALREPTRQFFPLQRSRLRGKLLRLPGLRLRLVVRVQGRFAQRVVVPRGNLRGELDAKKLRVDAQHAARELVPRLQIVETVETVPAGEVGTVEVARQSVVEAKKRALVAQDSRHRRFHLRPAVKRRRRLPRGFVEQRERVQRGERGTAVIPAGRELVAEEGKREIVHFGDLRSNSTMKRTSDSNAASADALRNRGEETSPRESPSESASESPWESPWESPRK